MNFFQAIILGIVQALTEYLPVSSSAHIRIIGDLMLGADPGAAFTAIIQIGTELAVILYFRRDIINILSHWFGCLFGKNGPDWRARMGRGDKYATLGWNVIVGSIPIIILGFTLQNIIETSLRNLWITVTVLFLFGLLLWIVDARSRQIKTMDDMNYRDAFLFGLGQSMALIPGVSRSGGTITVGRALGYTRESAVRLSFLMAIPAVFGSGLLEEGFFLCGFIHFLTLQDGVHPLNGADADLDVIGDIGAVQAANTVKLGKGAVVVIRRIGKEFPLRLLAQ